MVPTLGNLRDTPDRGAAQKLNAEITSISLRFWVSLALTVLVVGLAMVVPHLGGHVYWPMTQRWGAIAQSVLATPVVLWGCWTCFVRGWAGAKSGSPNRYTLIGLAVAVAYAYSVVAVLRPEIFPESLRNAYGQVELFFTAAAVIVTLALFGELRGLRRRLRAGV